MASAKTRQARLASNQRLYGRIDPGRVDPDTSNLDDRLRRIGDHLVFACECIRSDCTEQIELWLAEYEAIRGDPRRFLVAPSEEHVLAPGERIVVKSDRYFVVEE